MQNTGYIPRPRNRRREALAHRVIARDGLLDLSVEPPEKRIIKASALKDALGSLLAVGDDKIPRLRIISANVSNVFDLTCGIIPFPLVFQDCVFSDVLKLSEARLPGLAFLNCGIPKIEAGHLQVSGAVNFSGLYDCSHVDVSGAHITGDAQFRDASIDDPGTTVIDARNVKVGGDFDCSHVRLRGALSLEGAHVDGSIILEDAHIKDDRAGDDHKVLHADGAKVGYKLRGKGFDAQGLVSLEDFNCPGSIEFQKAHLTRVNSRDTALVLDRSIVKGSIFFTDEFTADGWIHAVGMDLGGSLYLDGATISRAGGAALNIDRSRVGGQVTCSHVSEFGVFIARGSVSLNGAVIAGKVNFRGASIRGARGISLTADGAVIGGEFMLDGGFSAKGKLSLAHAEVPRKLFLNAQGLLPPDPGAIAADLSRMTVGVLSLQGAPRRDGTVDLTGANADTMIDNPKDYLQTKSSLILNGFTYRQIHANGVRLQDRIAWLHAGTARVRTSADKYIPRKAGSVSQPWLELSTAYRRIGLGRDARLILVNKERERNKGIRWRNRSYVKLWNYAQDWVIGYGYVPWRAVIWILALLALGIGYFSVVEPPNHVNGGKGLFTIFDAVTYSFDLLLPIDVGGKSYWQPAGLGGTIIAILLSVAGWIFSLTALAGISRVVRE
jgi:hypothetical protein